MTDRILATEADLQAASAPQDEERHKAKENTIRHLWEKLERLRKEAETREQLYRNAFNLGALEHRRVIELQDRLKTLEGEWLARPRRVHETSAPNFKKIAEEAVDKRLGNAEIGSPIGLYEDVAEALQKTFEAGFNLTSNTKTPAAPTIYFAVPGDLPQSVKDFFLSLAVPILCGGRKTPPKFHVVSRGDFFATDVKIERIGTPPWTKIEILFVPEKPQR